VSVGFGGGGFCHCTDTGVAGAEDPGTLEPEVPDLFGGIIFVGAVAVEFEGTDMTSGTASPVPSFARRRAKIAANSDMRLKERFGNCIYIICKFTANI
jgi:hypothetical protein